MNDHRAMQRAIWIMVGVLIVLHQDIWLWDNATLLFGFLPVSLAYHMGISIAAGVVWFLATRYAWPVAEERAADGEKGGAA